MAIRFDDELNKRILRDVKNFNAKVRYNKTKTRGKGMLPRLISTRAIKDSYSDKSRAELVKQLKIFESYGNREAMQRASDNSRISKWELNYFKANRAKTEGFYKEEIADLQRIVGNKPEYFMKQHNRLQTLEDKLDFLNRDFETLTEDEIKIMRSVFGYAERSELTKRRGFQTYLNQLDRVLKLRRVPKSKREELLNKFNVLSENEFTEMTRNESLIDRIYELIHSPERRGKYELTVDEAEADELIEELWSTVDDIIAKYKTSK